MIGNTDTEGEVGTREHRVLDTLLSSAISEIFLSEVSADKLNFLLITSSPEIGFSLLENILHAALTCILVGWTTVLGFSILPADSSFRAYSAVRSSDFVVVLLQVSAEPIIWSKLNSSPVIGVR